MPARRLAEGLVAQRPLDRNADRLRIGRIETGLRCDQVPQRVDIGHDRDGAARHRLCDGKPVTLYERGEAQELGRLIEAEHRLLGDVPGQQDSARDVVRSRHVAEVIRRQFGEVPDHDELASAAQRLGQTCESNDERLDVLSTVASGRVEDEGGLQAGHVRLGYKARFGRRRGGCESPCRAGADHVHALRA